MRLFSLAVYRLNRRKSKNGPTVRKMTEVTQSRVLPLLISRSLGKPGSMSPICAAGRHPYSTCTRFKVHRLLGPFKCYVMLFF